MREKRQRPKGKTAKPKAKQTKGKGKGRYGKANKRMMRKARSTGEAGDFPCTVHRVPCTASGGRYGTQVRPHHPGNPVARLISIVDEADTTVARTAFSSLLRDAHDYTCMFTDRKGRELAQGSFATPGQSGAMALGIKNLVNKLPERQLQARRRLHHQRPLGPGRASQRRVRHEPDLLQGKDRRPSPPACSITRISAAGSLRTTTRSLRKGSSSRW